MSIVVRSGYRFSGNDFDTLAHKIATLAPEARALSRRHNAALIGRHLARLYDSSHQATMSSEIPDIRTLFREAIVSVVEERKKSLGVGIRSPDYDCELKFSVWQDQPGQTLLLCSTEQGDLYDPMLARAAWLQPFSIDTRICAESNGISEDEFGRRRAAWSNSTEGSKLKATFEIVDDHGEMPTYQQVFKAIRPASVRALEVADEHICRDFMGENAPHGGSALFTAAVRWSRERHKEPWAGRVTRYAEKLMSSGQIRDVPKDLFVSSFDRGLSSNWADYGRQTFDRAMHPSCAWSVTGPAEALSILSKADQDVDHAVKSIVRRHAAVAICRVYDLACLSWSGGISPVEGLLQSLERQSPASLVYESEWPGIVESASVKAQILSHGKGFALALWAHSPSSIVEAVSSHIHYNRPLHDVTVQKGLTRIRIGRGVDTAGSYVPTTSEILASLPSLPERVSAVEVALSDRGGFGLVKDIISGMKPVLDERDLFQPLRPRAAPSVGLSGP